MKHKPMTPAEREARRQYQEDARNEAYHDALDSEDEDGEEPGEYEWKSSRGC